MLDSTEGARNINAPDTTCSRLTATVVLVLLVWSDPLSRRLYASSLSSISSLVDLPAQFVPFGSARGAAESVTGADSDAPVVRAMAVHPTLPVLALLQRDEVHCYDVQPGGAAAAASNLAHLPLALQSLERSGSPAVVQGSWVQRTLRHPLMARSCSVAWAPPGGQMVAVGTETGVLCLWQLVSVPAAAAGHASAPSAAAAQSQGAPAGMGMGAGAFAPAAPAASARRLGAWLHVLHHPSLASLPLSHLAFSPCGRWLAVASRARTGFVLWNVAAALAQPGSATGSSGGAAAFIDKPLSSVLEAGAGVDALRWSPRGDALLVASSPRAGRGFAAAAAAALARATLRGARRAWNKATGREEAAEPEGDEKKVEQADAAEPATATAAKLPAGTLTVWNATSWTHESWATAAPLTDAAWSAAPQPRGAPALLLLSMQGCAVVQSVAVHIPSTRAEADAAAAAAAVSVSVNARPFASSVGAAPARAPTTSALANSSIRIDCSETEGLPPTRSPSDPAVALETYRLGGAVARMAWSASGARLAVSFAEGCAGSPLVAIFAVNRVQGIDTWQVLPVGVVRGPVCPCGGRTHPAQPASPAAAATGARRNADLDADDQEAELERKYASSPDSDSDAHEHEHKALYPNLAAAATADARPRICAAPNTPVHLSFLNAHASAGELLAISWKFGQVSFVPLYFSQA